jgi:hypothetical protein
LRNHWGFRHVVSNLRRLSNHAGQSHPDVLESGEDRRPALLFTCVLVLQSLQILMATKSSQFG